MVEKISRENGAAVPAISTDAWSVLSRYNWPGNVRELQNVIRRALALSEAQRQAMSEAAISHARTNYSKHDMCLRTLSVYAEVLPDHIGARLA